LLRGRGGANFQEGEMTERRPRLKSLRIPEDVTHYIQQQLGRNGTTFSGEVTALLRAAVAAEKKGDRSADQYRYLEGH
jgi:hypothetical protein